MAIVQKYRAYIEFMDTAGDTTRKTFDMSANVIDDPGADAALQALVIAFAAVTTAVIINYGWCRHYYDDAVSYPANAELQNTALITIEVSNIPGKSASFSIPSPVDALFVSLNGPGYNEVDTGNALLVALLNEFNVSGNFTLSDGEYWSGTNAGRRVHRKSRRG